MSQNENYLKMCDEAKLGYQMVSLTTGIDANLLALEGAEICNETTERLVGLYPTVDSNLIDAETVALMDAVQEQLVETIQMFHIMYVKEANAQGLVKGGKSDEEITAEGPEKGECGEATVQLNDGKAPHSNS